MVPLPRRSAWPRKVAERKKRKGVAARSEGARVDGEGADWARSEEAGIGREGNREEGARQMGGAFVYLGIQLEKRYGRHGGEDRTV